MRPLAARTGPLRIRFCSASTLYSEAPSTCKRQSPTPRTSRITATTYCEIASLSADTLSLRARWGASGDISALLQCTAACRHTVSEDTVSAEQAPVPRHLLFQQLKAIKQQKD